MQSPIRRIIGFLLIVLMAGCTNDYYGTRKPSPAEQEAIDARSREKTLAGFGEAAVKILGSLAENAAK